MFFVAKICKRALRASIEGYLAVAASTPTYSSLWEKTIKDPQRCYIHGLDSCGVWWSQNDYRAQVGSLGQVTPPTSHNRDKLCTRTESWKVEPFVLGCFTSTYISVSFSLWFGLCAGVIFWLSTLNSFRMPILADRQFQIFSDKYSPLGLWLKY